MSPFIFLLGLVSARTLLHLSFLQSPQSTVPITIDSFPDPQKNDLGFWHGALENLPVTYSPSSVTLYPSDPDQIYHTELSPAQCFDLTPFQTWYLHITLTGAPHFSVSLNQNNIFCTPRRNPYPETWDSLDAARYSIRNASGTEIYMPLSHFHIDLSRVVSVSLGGFYQPYTPVKVSKIELVPTPPGNFPIPPKLRNGVLRLACTRPGSFAFGIDDGLPWLAREVMEILESEGVLATFFVVGRGLRDRRTGFGEFYRKMIARGHQIALHSDLHRKMEALEDKDIDDDIRSNIATFQSILSIKSKYFRPPYGTIGARTRQHLAKHITDPQIINWSVDIEDWMWADSETPERQLDAFYRDVERGGNLAVMHYLSPSTVGYFREIIKFVKARNLTIMRIDQCLEDRDAPLFSL
ncbi:hypothetical protein BDV25DRAFT_168677 [Aspergillus avenaceus]|uniref:NodB homology domain-containing protein n=1 Tax=Aspergillus avenaceus TaxID=36643 RepID=A0A5N6TP18_ASPAV|nr:hypothetical protein BDV25DRAFT_168677 [Aspergillus avenaceus]